MSAAPPEDPELLSILSSALEMRDQGLEPPVEELCGNRPDLVQRVREAIDLVGELPRIQVDAAEHDPHQAQVLCGRYQLEERVGSGAMGVVYRAVDLELQRQVAAKILRSDSMTAAEAEERFVREAELLASIRHPAVITVHDRGVTEEGQRFLITELLEGCSLADLLEGNRRKEESSDAGGTEWIAKELGCESLPESSYLRAAVRWAADLAGGLSAAHESGVIHRDVKPSNVFIEPDGKPLLLDFGIASSSSQATLMREGGALGTPAYMPPEALNPSVEPKPSFDVYGLTATLYHLLCRRAPYDGAPSQVIAALAAKDPVPASKLRPGLPRDLQAILDKGMARRPSQRYASASGLESDLRAFLDYRPVSARPISFAGRTWRRLRQSKALLAAASVALVALALLVGSILVANHRAARAEQFMDAWEHLPLGLGLWSPKTRKIVDPSERSSIERNLDRAVATSAHPLPARLARAAFRFDQGDRRGAAEDMARTASVLATPFAKALAHRYKEAAAEDSAAFKFEGLPEPSSALDSYLAAFHHIRHLKGKEDFLKARELLLAEGLEEYPPAIEILIPLIEITNESLPDERKPLGLFENYERAVRLEELRGRRTAATAQLVGVTLISRKHYGEAIAPLRDGVELCPEAYGLRLHLGMAERRYRAGEEALKQLRLAAKMRPSLTAPFTTLARTHLWRREWGEARSVLGRTPYSSSDQDRQSEHRLAGDIDCAEAVEQYLQSKLEVALPLAESALEHYTAAVELGLETDFPQWEISRALLEGNEGQIFEALVGLVREEPLQWRRLRTLMDWMPDDLDSNQTRLFLTYLEALHGALAARGE